MLAPMTSLAVQAQITSVTSQVVSAREGAEDVLRQVLQMRLIDSDNSALKKLDRQLGATVRSLAKAEGLLAQTATDEIVADD